MANIKILCLSIFLSLYTIYRRHRYPYHINKTNQYPLAKYQILIPRQKSHNKHLAINFDSRSTKSQNIVFV